MKKLVSKIKASAVKKRAAAFMAVMALVCVMAVPAFAEGEPTGTAAISSAVTTALASTQSDALSLIASVLPYALAIVGAVIVVTIGIRVFKKISGR